MDRMRMKRGLYVLLIVVVQAILMSGIGTAMAMAPQDDAAAQVAATEKPAEANSRGGKLATFLESKGVPAEVVVVLIAALPIVELRGAVPVAHHVFHMGLVQSFVLSVVGNLLPVPFILLLLGPVSNVLRKIKLFDRFFEWLFARTRRRTESIQRYQELGLIIFIAIPLPATGAWTGALAAFLFGLRFWRSMACVVAGVSIAGVIVSVFSAFGWIGAAAAGLILSGMAAAAVLGRRKSAAGELPAGEDRSAAE